MEYRLVGGGHFAADERVFEGYLAGGAEPYILPDAHIAVAHHGSAVPAAAHLHGLVAEKSVAGIAAVGAEKIPLMARSGCAGVIGLIDRDFELVGAGTLQGRSDVETEAAEHPYYLLVSGDAHAVKAYVRPVVDSVEMKPDMGSSCHLGGKSE